MKKSILIFCLILALSSSAWALVGAKGGTCLTGGTSGCLDYFSGSALNDGDVAIIVTDGLTYVYRLDADSAAAESSPAIISPNTDAGDKRWILQEVVDSATINTLADSATPSIAAGKKFLTGGTTTITNFTGGYTGKEFLIIAEHSITITDGTNIFLNGSANFVMAATDTLKLVQKADGKFYETGRSDN